MPSRPTGPWVRAAIFANGDMKEFQNDFWYIPSAVPDWGAIGIHAADIVNVLVAAISLVMSSEWKTRGGYVEFSDGTNVVGVDEYVDTPGTVDSPPLPQDVSVVVRRLTNNPTASGRGRIYVGGVPESFSDGSYLSLAGNSAFLTFRDTMQDIIPSSGFTFTPAFFSPKLGGPLVPTVVWDYVGLLATKRRRRGPF